jgi:hypothetical protein
VAVVGQVMAGDSGSRPATNEEDVDFDSSAPLMMGRSGSMGVGAGDQSLLVGELQAMELPPSMEG